MYKAISLLLLFLTSNIVAHNDGNSHNIPRLEKNNIQIDGNLDEVQWQQALPIDLPFVTWPLRNQPAPVTTTVLVFEDGENLYIAFNAKDPNPNKIRAYYKDRDKIRFDDHVLVSIDSFNEHRLVYNFGSNPLGAQADFIYDVLRDSDNSSWNAIWDSAGKITADGYIVEFSIPFKAINFTANAPLQTWGINFTRNYPRDVGMNISVSKIDYSDNCRACQLQHFSGMPNLKNSEKIELTPSLTFGSTKDRDIDQTPIETYQNTEKSEVGVDFKWSLGTDLTVNATANPDFSQVEADTPQLSINNNFSLSFPEKRLFFLDNIEYFSTPNRLVYTRNIANPDYGVKLTGRRDQHSFGALIAKDDSTNFIVPGNLNSSAASLDTKSNNAVLRYANNLNDNLTIGLISTLRNSNHYDNSVFGLDLQFKIDKNQTVVAQVLSSDSQYPTSLVNEFCDTEDACNTQLELQCTFSDCVSNEIAQRTVRTNFSGNAMQLRYSNQRSNWWYFGNHVEISDGFRADFGFIDEVDIKKSVIGGGRLWNNSKNSWWTNFRISGDSDITYNSAGAQLEQENEIQLRLSLRKQSNLALSFFERDKVGNRHNASVLTIKNNVTTFKERQVSLFANSNPIDNLYIEAGYSIGDRIDYSNNRLGELQVVRSEIKWNLSRKAFFSAEYRHSNFTVNKKKLFDAQVWDSRITYNFSNKSLVRLIRSQTSINRNVNNYIYDNVEPVYKNYATQLIYSYKINPQSLLFVGYSDGGYSPENYIEAIKQGHTFFMKISYLI